MMLHDFQPFDFGFWRRIDEVGILGAEVLITEVLSQVVSSVIRRGLLLAITQKRRQEGI